MTKQYLTGALSSGEKYRVEDRLLENDFSYDAMEGLEHTSWDLCELHLAETESRIIEEFSIGQNRGINKTVAITLIGLFTTALLVTWYFSTGPETIDISLTDVETATTAPVDKQVDEHLNEVAIIPQPSDSTADTQPSEENTDDEPKIKDNETGTPPAKIQAPVKAEKNDERIANHIAVGRVIDVKGLAISNATVKSGNAVDTTDRSGYFALKLPKGGVRITVSHLATDYTVEIDSNQNWEIILDVTSRKVHDYRPINAANRFK